MGVQGGPVPAVLKPGAALLLLLAAGSAGAAEPPPPSPDDLLREEVRAVVPLVEEIAGAKFKEPPAVRFATPEEFEECVRAACPEGEDLDLFRVLTLGSYSHEEHVVLLSPALRAEMERRIARPEPRAAFRRLLAHELTHCLDQEDGGLVKALAAARDPIERRIRKSLLEGHAVLVEEAYAAREGVPAEKVLEFYDGSPISRIYRYGWNYLKRIENRAGREGVRRALSGEAPSLYEFFRWGSLDPKSGGAPVEWPPCAFLRRGGGGETAGFALDPEARWLWTLRLDGEGRAGPGPEATRLSSRMRFRFEPGKDAREMYMEALEAEVEGGGRRMAVRISPDEVVQEKGASVARFKRGEKGAPFDLSLLDRPVRRMRIEPSGRILRPEDLENSLFSALASSIGVENYLRLGVPEFPSDRLRPGDAWVQVQQIPFEHERWEAVPFHYEFVRTREEGGGATAEISVSCPVGRVEGLPYRIASAKGSITFDLRSGAAQGAYTLEFERTDPSGGPGAQSSVKIETTLAPLPRRQP